MSHPDPDETPGTPCPEEEVADPATEGAPFPFHPLENRGEEGGKSIPLESKSDAATPPVAQYDETVEAEAEAGAEAASDEVPTEEQAEQPTEEAQLVSDAAEPDPPGERETVGALEAIGAQLGVLTAIVEKKDAINAKLHEELTNHRRGQDNRRFQPFFTSLIRLEKSMLDHAAHLREQDREQDAKKIDGFAIELAIALENADVLRLEPTVLDPPPPFDARTQKIVGKVPTDELGRDGRVAAIVGARYILDEWTIEKERVRVFQYVAPTETQ